MGMGSGAASDCDHVSGSEHADGFPYLHGEVTLVCRCINPFGALLMGLARGFLLFMTVIVVIIIFFLSLFYFFIYLILNSFWRIVIVIIVVDVTFFLQLV